MPEIVQCMRLASRPVSTMFDYLQARPWSGAHRLELRDGTLLDVETYEDLVTAWIVFFRREYHIAGGAQTILDLGANIGCFTLLAAHERPAARIVSVEPYPPTFARLDRTVRTNALEGRVTAWRLGVAARDEARLIPDGHWPSQSLGMLESGAVATAPATTIDCRSLDQILAQACATLGVEEIDFVKMDIEGAEHEAVRAVSREGLRRARSIGLEYHPNADRAGLFDAFVTLGL